MKLRLKQGFTILLFYFGLATNLYSQDWDFELYPRMDIRTDHLEGEILITPDGVIEGDLRYTMEVKRVTSERFFLDGVNLEVLEAVIDGVEVSFISEEGRIYLEPEVPFIRGDQFTLQIRYRAAPLFGMHLHHSGVIRTSLLPLSVRHWLPVFDHPATSFSYRLEFIHPAGYEMIAGGNRSLSDIVSVEQERTVVSSEIALPVTSLGWIAGSFPVQRSVESADWGRITFYSERDYYGIEGLLEEASEIAERLLNLTGLLPFENLSIILLDQHFLEVKQYMAGSVMLYREKGSLLNQLRENLLAQWAGVYITEESWSDPDAVFYLRALLAQMAGLEITAPEGCDTGYLENALSGSPASIPYSAHTLCQFWRWYMYMDEDFSSDMQQNVMIILPELFQGGSRALSWKRFTEEVYRLTGQPFFDPVELPDRIFQDGVAETPNQQIEVTYNLEIIWEEGSSTAELLYEAAGEASVGTVTLVGREETFSDSNSFEVELTGKSGRVILSISPAVENISFTVVSDEKIRLEISKPYLFWITQLRNSESTDKKVEAVRALAQESENPDLQLLLGDLLQFEEDPVLVAELVRAISSLTRGASGTEERFIRYSAGNNPPEVQLAAVEALANFNGNERVIERLRTVAIQANNRELRESAIHSLSTISDAVRFAEIARNLVSRDQLLGTIPLILTYLADKGDSGLVIDIAEYFLGEDIEDTLRSDLIDVLIQADMESSNWVSRLPDIMQDRNPAVRIRAAGALKRVAPEVREELRNRLLKEEYDARVRIALSTSINP